MKSIYKATTREYSEDPANSVLLFDPVTLQFTAGPPMQEARAGHGVTGALVHIAQSPIEVPDAFAQDDTLPDRAARAKTSAAILDHW